MWYQEPGLLSKGASSKYLGLRLLLIHVSRQWRKRRAVGDMFIWVVIARRHIAPCMCSLDASIIVDEYIFVIRTTGMLVTFFSLAFEKYVQKLFRPNFQFFSFSSRSSVAMTCLRTKPCTYSVHLLCKGCLSLCIMMAFAGS